MWNLNQFILLFLPADLHLSNSMSRWIDISFLLFERSTSKICLEFGRCTMKGGETNVQKIEQDVFHEAKVFCFERKNKTELIFEE